MAPKSSSSTKKMIGENERQRTKSSRLIRSTTSRDTTPVEVSASNFEEERYIAQKNSGLSKNQYDEKIATALAIKSLYDALKEKGSGDDLVM